MSGCGNSVHLSTAGLPVYRKDPGSRLDYGFDLGAQGWLAQGETVTSLEVTAATPVGADALVIEAPTVAGGVIYAWISGGSLGKDYAVTFHWATSAGRVDERSLTLQVRNR